jgi:hypothetical protein
MHYGLFADVIEQLVATVGHTPRDYPSIDHLVSSVMSLHRAVESLGAGNPERGRVTPHSVDRFLRSWAPKRRFSTLERDLLRLRSLEFRRTCPTASKTSLRTRGCPGWQSDARTVFSQYVRFDDALWRRLERVEDKRLPVEGIDEQSA